MMAQLTALIVDESKWLTLSLGVALVAVSALLYRTRASDVPTRRRVLAAMNLFFGLTIGTMAFGHLLAVTTKVGQGTLTDRLVVYYGIGIALAIPSWWLILHTRAVLSTSRPHGRVTVGLNAALTLTLLALGLHNLPLAAPGLLNLGYHLHTRRAVGWAIVSLAVVANVALFVGSLIFLASGQSFEQFSGMG